MRIDQHAEQHQIGIVNGLIVGTTRKRNHLIVAHFFGLS
jgi:hypothetical protein